MTENRNSKFDVDSESLKSDFQKSLKKSQKNYLFFIYL